MLTAKFPEQVDAIRQLRSEDETFAEICNDYETLACLLPRDAADPTLDAIHESLDALEDEIRTYLGAAPKRADRRRQTLKP